MKSIFTLILACFITSIVFGQVKPLAIKTGHLKNPKVKEAYDTKWEKLRIELQASGINPDEFDLYFRIFKADKHLEVWMRNKGEVRYHLFKIYAICNSSMELESNNDNENVQISEGFFKVDAFNQKSTCQLSVQISYLNGTNINSKKGADVGKSSMVIGDSGDINGLSTSIDNMKELFVLCLEARNRNKPIYIDIYPTKLSDENIKMLEANYSKSKLTFWKNLKPIYDYFEENKWLPSISVDRKGHYILSEDETLIVSKAFSASSEK